MVSQNSKELHPARLLIVDDHRPVCRLLEKIFKDQGFEVYTAESGTEAIAIFKQHDFDVMLTDINMPDISGLNLLKEIKQKDQHVPVIMLTACQELQAAKDSFKFGAYDFLTKPFDKAEVMISVSRAMEHHRLIQENQEYQKRLENMVQVRTKELQMTLSRLENAFRENRQAHLESVIILAKIAEVNDEYTGNHIKRVSLYCEELSKLMKLPPKFIEEIVYSSPMHDIGKIFINPSVLKKQGKLTGDEFEHMKDHTVKGAKVLEGIPFLKMAYEIALYHHENYDGSGYPTKIKGETIPLAARIVTICDSFDALISERCYKKAYSAKTAITIMKSEVDRRFDPAIADLFFQNQDTMYHIYCDFKD